MSFISRKHLETNVCGGIPRVSCSSLICGPADARDGRSSRRQVWPVEALATHGPLLPVFGLSVTCRALRLVGVRVSAI